MIAFFGLTSLAHSPEALSGLLKRNLEQKRTILNQVGKARGARLAVLAEVGVELAQLDRIAQQYVIPAEVEAE